MLTMAAIHRCRVADHMAVKALEAPLSVMGDGGGVGTGVGRCHVTEFIWKIRNVDGRNDGRKM